MEGIKKFISTLTIAISNCSLYSKEHELVDEYARKVMSVIEEIMQDHIEIMAIEDDLIINKVPVRDAGLHGIKLLRRIKRKGISRIDLLRGITLPEIKQFIIDMSETDRGPRRYHHIKTGTVDIHLDEQKAKDLNIEELSYFTSAQIQKVKDIYYSISPFKKLQVTGLEEIVSNFILTFQKEANILKLLSPVRSYTEYTYTHATNVAVLSMFQAESLRIRGKLLHDIGISALLHDVGKLFISKEVLEKKDALDKAEFDEIKRHPLYGAVYLAKVEGLTRLAPVIAFEHHMKYDGTGYPKSNLNSKKQHICSQIVAISDFFDALRSSRPYRRSWDIKEILGLMKMNAGKDFNPFLVDNFARILLIAISR
jgi:HD-GYP domain-containing protein (c-di-GMP phosphodiesterase class II)